MELKKIILHYLDGRIERAYYVNPASLLAPPREPEAC